PRAATIASGAFRTRPIARLGCPGSHCPDAQSARRLCAPDGLSIQPAHGADSRKPGELSQLEQLAAFRRDRISLHSWNDVRRPACRWVPLARERPDDASFRRCLVHPGLPTDLEYRGTECYLRRALALPTERWDPAFPRRIFARSSGRL